MMGIIWASSIDFISYTSEIQFSGMQSPCFLSFFLPLHIYNIVPRNKYKRPAIAILNGFLPKTSEQR